MPPVHPDTLYHALLARPSRSERREFLPKFQAILARHYESGSTEFTIARVSKLCEAEGIIKGRVLYNAKSRDYRALIEAWALFSNAQGPQISPEMPENNGKEPLIQASKIGSKKPAKYVSPVLGTKILSLNPEILSLKTQVSLLSAEKKLLENKIKEDALIKETPAKLPRGRPLKTASNWELKQENVDALKKAINPRFLKSQGWKVNPRGEVLNAAGEVVYEAGYIQAIKKLLVNAE